MNIKPYMSRRAIRMASALTLATTMVVAVSLLTTGARAAAAFDAAAPAAPAAPAPPAIPARYAEQCSNGIAVPNPADNPGLVSDCATLLASMSTLAGASGSLDWSADSAVSEWAGVIIANNRVSILDLRAKDLDGAIPAELGNLANLAELELLENRLTGEIPPELGNLVNLRTLNLRSNEWSGGNGLTGAIPPELGNLANLGWLQLSSNNLTGEIPAELGNFADIRHLSLSHNNLTGEIPAELGNLVSLRNLRLFNNNLTGAIPPELGNLSNLITLRLGANQLTGCIPQSLREAASAHSQEQDSGFTPPFCDATTAPTPTPTIVVTATDDPCVERIAGSGGVNGSWATGCVSANPPNAFDYYARFYTFTLDAASDVTITLSSDAAAPYLYLLDGEGRDGEIKRETGAANASAATMTETLQPGSYTIESTTYYSETAGDFTLEFEATAASGAPADACAEPISASGRVSGSWAPGCLSANSPGADDYYARFYTFTLDAASEVTITLSCNDAAPYLYLLNGAGTGGEINQEKGAATASSAAITATLQPGDYTIEATTYYSETTGDFTLELEIAQ